MNLFVPRLRHTGLFGLAALAAGFSGCSRETKTAMAGGPAAVPVQVAVAVRQDVPRMIEAIGNVQSLRTVAIKSQVDGIIAEIHFREGQDVKAGDLLVTLDRRPFQNTLRIANADLVNARAEAARAAAARAQVLAKEAAVANAELLLGYTQIKAPIAGRTGQLVLHEGALVKANDNAFTIVTVNQLAPIAVTYSVPERSLEEIRAALAEQRAVVTVTERNSGLTREGGRLEFIDNTVDAATGMITLKAVFANEDGALWPGRFVQVRTQIGIDRDAVVVPATAVLTSQTGSTIYVVKPDRTVELRTVKVARTVGDTTLIGAGVTAGETVVTDGQLRLLPGMKAEARNQSGAPLAAAPGTN